MMLKFILMLAVLATIHAKSCLRKGRGCSWVTNSEPQYDELFEKSCSWFHLCHTCGNEHGLNIGHCYAELLRDMKEDCNSVSEDVKTWQCVFKAVTYLPDILSMSSGFRDDSEEWCTKPWVSNCLNFKYETDDDTD